MRNSTQNFWRFKKPFFEMSKSIHLKWIHFQKRGYRGIRQEQINFKYRSLVQFKVTSKYDFLKCQSNSCIFLKWFHSKCGYRGIRQKQLNFRCRSFSSKSRENCFFWNVKSYSCIYLKWILFQKRGYRGIRQKQLNFRCSADHCFCSKPRENMIFFKCQKLFIYLFEMNSFPKTWLKRH